MARHLDMDCESIQRLKGKRTSSMSILVYICGAYTNGNPEANTREAIVAADMVLTAGFIPFVPHLSHFWHGISPKDYETWMKIDFEMVRRCDCLYRFPSAIQSKGADREESLARELGKPIFYLLQDLIDFYDV